MSKSKKAKQTEKDGKGKEKSKKQYLNGNLVEVAKGDEVIRVSHFDIYDGTKVMCEIGEDYETLCKNLYTNVQRTFAKLSLAEKREVIRKRTDQAGALILTKHEDMLRSEYRKAGCTTESSLLFMAPEDLKGPGIVLPSEGKKIKDE